MSHVVGIDVVFDDLDKLAIAAELCGCELVRDQKEHKWYGKWVDDYDEQDAAYNKLNIKPEDYGKCEHAIRVKDNPDAYEVGLIKNPKGGYNMVYDFFGPEGAALQDKIGRHAMKIASVYSNQRLSAVAKMKGKKILVEQEGTKRILRIRNR